MADQMTDQERILLEDPFLEPTTEINFAARSGAFQSEWRKKFGISPPRPSEWDTAMDARIEADPSVKLMGQLNALMRDKTVRQELSERDPRFRQKWKGNMIEEVALEFRRRCPDYFVSEWNHEVIVDWMTRHFLERGGLEADEAVDMLFDRDFWTVENLTTAYLACLDAGGLQVQPGKTRKLTQQEQLEIVSTAQINGPADAIVEYISKSLGYLADDNNNAAAVARFRAQNPAICNEATRFVFRALAANGLTEENWQDFVAMVTPRSPLLTYAQLEQWFIEWSRATKSSALFPNGRVAAQETTNPDDMTNEELAAAILAQRRAAVRQRQRVR